MGRRPVLRRRPEAEKRPLEMITEKREDALPHTSPGVGLTRGPCGGSGGSNQMHARVQNRGWVGGDVGVTKGSMSLSSGEEKTVLRQGQALHLLPSRSSTGA